MRDGCIRCIRHHNGTPSLLRAVSGAIPAGQSDLNPALNAQQTLVAVKRGGAWRSTRTRLPNFTYDLTQRLTDALRAAR